MVTAATVIKLLRDHADSGYVELANVEDRIVYLFAHQQERMFRIQNGPSIPWRVIAPFEFQAQRNHSQSLERLHERGGLSVLEAIAVLQARDWFPDFGSLPIVAQAHKPEMKVEAINILQGIVTSRLASMTAPVQPNVSGAESR